MIVKHLKKLVEKLGGDPTGKNTKAELLDCLCGCQIGGGGGYDLVIKHDEDTGNCAIAQGSYEAVATKLDNGDIPDVRIVRYWSSSSDPSWHSVNCLSISYGGDEEVVLSATYGTDIIWVNYWVEPDNTVSCTYPD
jgi:hypothetical protein